MATFIPGLTLNRAFFTDAVRPILTRAFPRLGFAAARIGPGSDVLGFDTPMSMDHDWGPGLLLLLQDEDAALAPALYETLRQALPAQFAGYAVDTTRAIDDTSGDIPVQSHRVRALSLRQFVEEQLAHDIDTPLTPADWLTIPSQKLREMTAGAVYEDTIGALTAFRETLNDYPHDIWLYLLAAGWQRIAQEEHLMPRAGYAGDELGASIIASRLVRDSMQLCFLMERQYAPYPKWFGTAFRQLKSAANLTTTMHRIQTAATWQERETGLCHVYEYLAEQHNALQITKPLPTACTSFYSRPFSVILGERFANAICEQIHDPRVARIASRRLIGSIDQWSDNTDIRSDPRWRLTFRALYE